MRDWLEVLNPRVHERLGHVKHALIDFDGTISVIRQGWEGVMIPLMLEAICDTNPPTQRIEKEVRDYVDYSTGMLTIKQMDWLADAVRRHGISKNAKDKYEYKRMYNARVLKYIEERLRRLKNGEVRPEDMMVMGSRLFLEALKRHRVTLFLASGTDHEYVHDEAGTLGIAELFDGGIYGALDHTEAHTKERIIERILEDNRLGGSELLVAGDGPVEIRNARSRDAIALGIATDEVRRCGMNARKRTRLIEAGADLIVADFTHWKELVAYLFAEVPVT